MSALLNRHGSLAAIPVGIALLASMGLSRAGAADPVIPLPDEDRERLEKGLGPGIVGKAVKAGGRSEPTPNQDLGFMYGRSFEDPDGHVWENVFMDMAAVPEGETPAVQPVA